jgi:hypothetical protein
VQYGKDVGKARLIKLEREAPSGCGWFTKRTIRAYPHKRNPPIRIVNGMRPARQNNHPAEIEINFHFVGNDGSIDHVDWSCRVLSNITPLEVLEDSRLSMLEKTSRAAVKNFVEKRSGNNPPLPSSSISRLRATSTSSSCMPPPKFGCTGTSRLTV